MDWTAAVVVPAIFIGMPWIFLHYSMQFRKAKGITIEDENLLDDLHATARRLDARLDSIERIIAADNPGWKAGSLGRSGGDQYLGSPATDRLAADHDDRRDGSEPRLAYRR